jgi:hypothetical protein
MKKLLITGDSFAADWTKKYEGIGWVNMLCKDFDVTNIAQAGVSEYKIHKQLSSQDVTQYDYVLVSHTSPYRIPIIEHPIHLNDTLHKDCDLIYSDIKEHVKNPIAKIAVDFYENIFYPEYFIYTYELMMNQIQIEYPNAINVTFFNNFKNDKVVGFEDIYLNNKGLINHMNNKGNKTIYNKIKNLINE